MSNKKQAIAESELVLNKDGSVYHLNLRPEDIGDTIILVGDPGRVEKVSKNFDKISIKKEKREFISHTGEINKKRVSVISTGIGMDNIDIVINELDALVNIDLKTRIEKEKKTSLNFIRIGTCGSLQEDIELGSCFLSESGMSLGGPLPFYLNSDVVEEKFQLLIDDLRKFWNEKGLDVIPRVYSSSEVLKEKFSGVAENSGNTYTGNGFYGPQGRVLRLPTKVDNFIEIMAKYDFKSYRLHNIEMETACIYGFSKALGHQGLSLNCVLANRHGKTFTKDAGKAMEKIILNTLEVVSSL